MDATHLTLAAIIVFALLFDFTNGFHDTANSIATMVGTRALPPQIAVLIATAFNFIGAFMSLKVAATVGKDIIDPNQISGNLNIVIGGLVGAIIWNLITWYVGIPSSSSHALIGGLIGAGVAAGGNGLVLWGNIGNKVLKPAVLAPLLGGLGAILLMAILMRVFRNANPGRANKAFRIMQIFSGSWLSLTHGKNDAQKTMGIIALALLASNADKNAEFNVPMWVVLSSASAMALGTYAGGWKIIKTLGTKVVKMQPIQGFAASTTAALVLETTARLGFPVSTTHCVSGCVMGAGASKRLSSVRWGVAGDIVTAWILTLPCAAVVGAMAYGLASISPLVLILIAGGGGYFVHSQVEQRNARTLEQGFHA